MVPRARCSRRRRREPRSRRSIFFQRPPGRTDRVGAEGNNKMEEPPAKKRKECPSSSASSKSHLGSLPESVLGILIEFIGDAATALRTLLRLAAVSRSWSQRVYGEGALWRRIDFSNTTPSSRDRLTDRLLLAFLRRIDAKTYTEEICLRNCARLSGRGIGPLRGSKVLRRVDLLFSPQQGSSAMDIDWESLERTLTSFHPFSKKRSEGNLRHTSTTDDEKSTCPGLESLQLPKIAPGTDKKNRDMRIAYSSMIKTFHRNFLSWSRDLKNASDGLVLKCNVCQEDNLVYYFASDFMCRMAVKSICLGHCNGTECYTCGEIVSSVNMCCEFC